MLEKPGIDESTIAGGLEREFGLDVVELSFLPIGNDARTAAYRLVARRQAPLYVKLRSGAFFESAITVPKLLYGNGSENVIAPIPTLDGRLWVRLD